MSEQTSEAREHGVRDYGCSDHGCVFGPRGGMGTNGGCQCLSEVARRSVSAKLMVERGIRDLCALLEQKDADLEAARGLLREWCGAFDAAAKRPNAGETPLPNDFILACDRLRRAADAHLDGATHGQTSSGEGA